MNENDYYANLAGRNVWILVCYPQRCSHVSSFHLRQVYERNHACATYTHHGEKSLGRRTKRRARCRTSRRHTNQTDQAVGCDKHAGDPCVLLLSLSYLRRLHHHSLVSTATTALHVPSASSSSSVCCACFLRQSGGMELMRYFPHQSLTH